MMREYVHGYLSMDNRLGGIDEYRKGSDLSASIFREMFAELNLPGETLIES